jgi:cytochrome c oxidase subunit 2
MIPAATARWAMLAENDFGVTSGEWVRGPQSVLDPAGPQSGRIHQLFLDYFWLSVVVYVLVVLFVIFAVILRRRRARWTGPILAEPAPSREKLRGWLVGLATLATTVALFFLLAGDHAAGRAIRSLSTDNALKIRVTGHQWWWEFRFEDEAPSKIFTTANEIHIPVGRTIEVELHSPDVIHSFWVPNLHGKRDMIPGHPTRIAFRADKAGEYWGQCAEFCGYEHAKMRFRVVAEPEEKFNAWKAAQLQSSVQPATDSQKKGQYVFLHTTCVMCHTIQGTTAGAMMGPDLTHLASRKTIAAGSLPNKRGHLAGWISNPQTIKPGVRMPANSLPPDQLQALLDYLEILK